MRSNHVAADRNVRAPGQECMGSCTGFPLGTAERNVMKTSEYLFPQRLSRRDFLKWTSVAAAGLAVPGVGQADEGKAPVRLGTGTNTYEMVVGLGATQD